MYTAIRSNMIEKAGWNDIEAIRPQLDLEGLELQIDTDLVVKGFGGEVFDLDLVDGRMQLKSYLRRLQLTPAAILMANDFSGADLDWQISWAVRTGEVAADLDISAVRVDLVPRHGISEQDFLRRATKAMAEVVSKSPSTVRYGVENHGGFTNDPKWLQQLLDGVDSKRFGITLDSGNFYWFGWPLDDVYAQIKQYAAHTVHVHLKNIAYPADQQQVRRGMGWRYGDYVCPLPDGDIDHRLVCQYLSDAGYKGGLAIEDESLGRYPLKERQAILRRGIAYVNDCLQSIKE